MSEPLVKVVSVGVDDRGASVLRLLIDGRPVDIETNVRGLARLAELGVRVQNNLPRRKG